MSKFRFVEYEGSDDQIAQLVSKLVNPPKGTDGDDLAKVTSNGSPAWQNIANRFERSISKTAAAGRPAQKNAISAWLRSGGEIQLTKLWKAAGVKTQHDYSGVGGSLTKNMKKAHGPRDWYEAHVDSNGEWIYKILPELIDPLKRAFGVA